MVAPLEMELTVTTGLARPAPTVAVAIHLQGRMTLTSIGVSAVQCSNLALAKESSNMQKSWQAEPQMTRKKRMQNLYE